MSTIAANLNDPINGVKGKVEHISSRKIRGWIYAPGGMETEIILWMNGERMDATKPAIRRPIIQSKLKAEVHCGFEFQMPQIDRNRVSTFKIQDAVTGYSFNVDIHRFCPLVEKFTDELKKIFFAEFYRYRYELNGMSNSEAFRHYVQCGIYDDFDPNPWFSSDYYRRNFPQKLKNIELPILSYLNFESDLKIRTSEHFDPEFYIESNPDLGSNYGLLKHYVNYGHQEDRQPCARQLPVDVVEEIEALSSIEPELNNFNRKPRAIVEYPALSPSTFVPRLIQRQFEGPIKVVICVPFLSCGGADLISTYVLKAYQQHYGKKHVLLLVTDRAENKMPHWLEKGTQVVYLDQQGTYRNLEDKVGTLHTTIGLLSPEKIVNVNSAAAWEVYRHYGRQLASVIDLYAYLFCFDYTPDNRLAGYIKDYVPKTVKYLKRVFCDNQTIIDDMQSLYGFSQINNDVFKSVYVPIPDDLKAGCEPQKDIFNKKILWISRLARQKRPELLLRIAQSMPEHQFVVYGPEGDSPACADIVEGQVSNIEYRGVFQTLNELDFSEFSLFLNTSAWDGLPTILIQLMGAGIPIVTSTVGGIDELVTSDTGWLVKNDDTDEFCTVIKRILIGSDVIEEKVNNGLSLIKERHTWESFVNRMASIGAFDPLEDTERRTIPTVDRRKY